MGAEVDQMGVGARCLGQEWLNGKRSQMGVGADRSRDQMGGWELGPDKSSGQMGGQGSGASWEQGLDGEGWLSWSQMGVGTIWG